MNTVACPGGPNEIAASLVPSLKSKEACVAGGYRQLSFFAGGKFTKTFDEGSSTNDVSQPELFRFRVRDIHFIKPPTYCDGEASQTEPYPQIAAVIMKAAADAGGR